MHSPNTHQNSQPLTADIAWKYLSQRMLCLEQDILAYGHGEGVDAAVIAQRVESDFKVLVQTANTLIGEGSPLSPAERADVGKQWQEVLLPILTRSELGARMHGKPRGYAGDFFTIEMMYRGGVEKQPAGVLLDRCLMVTAASRAVCNRRGLMREAIGHTLAAVGGRPAKITSLACGPAREIFDCEDALKAGQINATLVDLDPKALAFVKERAAELEVSQHLRLERRNLLALAAGTVELAQVEQDLVYSIGLIDYLDDQMVVSLLDWIHGQLTPGGRVILGNFHPDNSTRAVMEHVLEWNLIHRDEADMDRLFLASRFGAATTDVRFEEEGVNLFAECVKR